MEIANLVLAFLRVVLWPATILAIVVLFRRHVVALLGRIRRAELPGGVALDLDQEIREVKALSAEVQEQPSPPERERSLTRPRTAIPLTDANARMLQLGLRPSPSGLDMSYYRHLADQDPNVALAGIRIELDVMARNLAKARQLSTDEAESGARLFRKLYDAGAITGAQMQLAMKVLRVCNAAVHGTLVSREDANDVINSTEVLSDHYLAWLSWGFEDGWTPRK